MKDFPHFSFFSRHEWQTVGHGVYVALRIEGGGGTFSVSKNFLRRLSSSHVDYGTSFGVIVFIKKFV